MPFFPAHGGPFLSQLSFSLSISLTLKRHMFAEKILKVDFMSKEEILKSI